MTTLDACETTNPQITKLVMFLAAIGIAAMIIITHPFDVGGNANRARFDSPGASTTAIPRPQVTDWCCLGSKPAEWLGQGMTDVGDVTSSVDKIPRKSPLIVEMVWLDSVVAGKPPTNG